MALPTAPTRYGVNRAELAAALDGEPRYRLDQLWSGLYEQLADPGEITNLPKSLRARLADDLPLALAAVTESVSDSGDTVKFLWELDGGSRVETVLMLYRDRATVCVSSQAGCAMACGFCATGQAGFHRHLTVGEIVEQVVRASRRARDAGRRVSNIVFMGMGEPMANLDAVWQSVERFHGDLGLSARHITISTVGLIPGIRKLADLPLPVNLAVSLHAANDTLRDELVPINKRYPIDDLVEACDQYLAAKNRRVSFEWAMIDGVNDRDSDATELARICRRLYPARPRQPDPAQPDAGIPDAGHAVEAGPRVPRPARGGRCQCDGASEPGHRHRRGVRPARGRPTGDPQPAPSEIARVGDEQLVDHRGQQELTDLVDPIVELVTADPGRQRGIVRHAQLGESGGVFRSLRAAEVELAFDHRQHVGRHAGMELQSALGRCGNSRVRSTRGRPRRVGRQSERRAAPPSPRPFQGEEQVVFVLADPTTDRRQLVAAAHARQVRLGLADAHDRPLPGAQHLPPVHRRPIDRHPCRRFVRIDQFVVVPRPRRPEDARPNRHAFTHSQPRSSIGSPMWASSQSITAFKPVSPTMRFPRRKSPCTTAARPGAGRWSMSQLRTSSSTGWGWPRLSSTSVYKAT